MADFVETTSAGIASSRPAHPASIEGRGSWIAATVTLDTPSEQLLAELADLDFVRGVEWRR